MNKQENIPKTHKNMQEFKAEVHFEEWEKVPAHELKSRPGKGTLSTTNTNEENSRFDNWIQEPSLLLYSTKQITDNSNQDKAQIPKIRKLKRDLIVTEEITQHFKGLLWITLASIF